MKRHLILFGLWCVWAWPAAVQAQQAEESEVAPGQDLGVDEETTEPSEPLAEENIWVAWDLSLFGYIRAAFEYVQDDPTYDFVGNNNGFVLHNARFGISGINPELDFSFVISVDGAADLRESYNTPLGDLDVRLKDAFLRYDPIPYVGLQFGQFKAPFSAEEIRSTGDLAFVSRAVGLDGVPVGRGFEQEGLIFGRQLGAMLSPVEPIYLGDFGVAYYAALFNGNGYDEVLNDNSDLALAGRLVLFWSDLIQLGGAVWMNDRTEGTLPNLYQESDLAFSADLTVTWAGLEVFGQFTTLTTEFPTIGSPDRDQMAYHAQILYRFDQLCVPFAPAYRFAYFHPWSGGGSEAGGMDLDSFGLTYHTMGLVVWAPFFPARAVINYTITQEEQPRELENNRFDFLLQVDF